MSGREHRVPLKYKSLDDLKPLYNNLRLSGQDPRVLLKKLDKIFDTAEERLKLGDIEQAYILIMKYLNVLSYIQNSKDFLKDPKFYKMMLGKKPKEAMELAEKLNESLAEGYKNVKNHEEENKENANIPKPNIITELTDMREKKESKSTMTSVNLFNMLKDGVSKVLVMDARSSDDYKDSRIDFESMINIPDETLNKGQSANMLEKQLSDDSQYLFKSRGNYDQIVLLDWATNEENFDQSKLNVLKDILTKWDIETKYKNEILILDGGYEDWLNSYPWYTTKPVKPPLHHHEDILTDGNLDSVIYPDLDELNANIEQASLKPYFDRSKKPLKRTLNDLDYMESDDLLIEKHDEISRPSFDRAKKAAAIKTYEERKADLDEILAETFAETSAAVELERSRMDNEIELGEVIRKRREIEADEEQRKLLEEEEEKLFLKYEELRRESELKDDKIKELQEIVEIYKTKDKEEKAKKTENVETEKKEDEMREQIKLQEMEKERLAREREEMERAQLLELDKKKLEEKYKEKLEMARMLKKRFHDDDDSAMEINKTSSKIPFVNRANKPRIPEKIRYFNGVKHKVGRGLTGLKNLGNTCYMNSILQCISNNSVMLIYFYEGHYKEDINRFSKTKGEIAEEIAAVLKELWAGSFRSIACRDFRSTVGLYKPEYATYEQQDSHEFLTFLMDWLHNDLNKVRNPSAIDDENPGNDLGKAWRNFERKNQSLISTLFYGLQKSTVTCLKCNEKSVTFEPFSNLSLIIPEYDHCTLESCLRLYLKSERISGWRCPKCKDLREAEKRTELCKLPEILVIHLKRFHYIEILSRKRTSFVKFPISDLNMLQFALPNTNNSKNYSYNLYAISNHYGTMEGGHYTAFCKSPMFKRWYKFDDHEVVEIEPSEVRTSAAYILFYSSHENLVPSTVS